VTHSEADPAERPGVAAFDFDGTLVPGDSLTPFLRLLLGTRVVPAIGASAPSMLLAYRHAGRDGAKAALLSRVLVGLDAGTVEADGRAYAPGLVRRIRPAMLERIRWHRDEGHRLILVSASLAAYLEPFGAAVGFDEVIATRLEVGTGGRLTGRLLGANVRGEEKAVRLRAALGDDDFELWAYGDSAGDTEMLAMADHPLRVGRRSTR
jgi:phosphatidylglycerophosphatase C